MTSDSPHDQPATAEGELRHEAAVGGDGGDRDDDAEHLHDALRALSEVRLPEGFRADIEMAVAADRRRQRNAWVLAAASVTAWAVLLHKWVNVATSDLAAPL